MLSPIKQYDPSKLFGMTHTLFRDNPLPPPPKPKPKSKPQPRPVTFHQSSISIPGHQSSGSTPASPSVPPPTLSQPPTQSKDKEPMHQFTAHTVAHSSTHSSTIVDQTSDSNLVVSDSHTETDTKSSASTSDSEKSYADITKILMAQPTQGQTSHTEPYVDIPSEVEEEMPESSATNQPSPAQAQTNPPSQKSSNGSWFTFDDLSSHKWRQYRQLQFVDLPEVSSALAVLHDQFLGDPSAVFEAARLDYLNMKCCSLNAKDLDFHYKRMSMLFYMLNGFNEPTLKHVFLASLPEELQPGIQRQLTASNLALDNISLGKIFQLAKTCLDKLCEQKQFFKELLKDKEPFRSACKKPYLQIKCKKKKDYLESPIDFSERNHPLPENSNESTQVDVSSARKKVTMLKIVPTKEKNPSDEPNDETVFALQNSSDDSDSDQSQVIFHQQLLSLDTIVPIPSIKLHILPSKFQKPIPAIGLIDSGAQRSMINPNILPPEYWTKFEENFRAVNGKLFTTSLITTKPIGIQIFPNYVIWTKVIGSTLPNKDILLGFDILHQIKHLQIIPTGIRVKSMFKPFTDVLKLYNLSETPQSYQDISTKLLSFCPESHSEFTHPNSLWKNKSFFIKLPFKLNEDINPTKATHPGMSPSDLLLAQKECSQLLAQGLIEPTSSQWACQAFYVEKHFEIARGKKRLVIDYQPLNMFLQDDKFPLPRRQSMFTFLKNAQIFSKVDLKSGSHDEHCQLLTQFYDIIQSHGIMLSAKKSTIATDNIEFLDASDESWGAILLEELNDKEHFIAYASGQFSDTQKHYHSVFKEILAVKNGIKKFEYHLIGHHFLIRMDSSAFPNIFNFKGLTLDPSKETTEDVLWPYFQHPDTNLFWTQDQVYEWFTAPHIVVIENEIQSTLHNYLCQLNHQTPPHKDIFHTSLGPQHDLIMIPTPSAISKPKSTGIIIKEEKPDYTDFLYQDSQNPWEEFLPLSQHLQQFPQPTMCEPGSSSQPSKADKATQMPSPKSQPSLSKPGYRRDCPYPPCRGPQYSKKVCFGLYNPRENVLKVFYRGISAGNPSLRTTGPKYSLNCCSSGITTPRTYHHQLSANLLPNQRIKNPCTSLLLTCRPFIKPFESVLNWQTQNVRAQNDTLLHLNSKVEKISLRTEQIETKVDSITAQMQQIHQNLQSRIGQLDSELRAMLAHRYNGPEFDQKEKEIRRLKVKLAQIESEKQRPTLFTTSPPIPSIGPTTPRIFMSSGAERITPSWLPLIRCRSRCLHWSCIGMELLIVGDPFKRHKLNELMTGNLSRDLDDCGDLVEFR
ncbi:hypothetical protein KPL71_023868 [Citrus sinensis]|uniref:Uncharacterized protein n=1 Tax=Citrus sinensis TaxID=2711 RepID=A0ACB8IM70_CITSI|nr:hypothetical protein KPL71_023868 [Citrus sinensis]